MITSWLGLILGVGAIIIGQILEGGHLEQLMVPTAALIVLGGTLGATMLSTSMKEFSGAIRAIPKVFFSKTPDFTPLIKEIVSMAATARREGILGLERLVGNISSPFFANNLRHVIDGYDPAVLQDMMDTFISHAEEEKTAVAKVFDTAGGFAPTIGIIGAVLGLIHVMSNLSDSSKLGSGIAVAFVATVYGVGLANLFLLPVGGKLKKNVKYEIMELELIALGLSGIQNGLNPRVIEDRLNNLLGEYTLAEGASPTAEKKAA